MGPEEVRPEIHALVETSEYGKYAVEPMERGYATTVGNALRRVLLSSIEGAAITKVKITGVLHEFSTIPGVKEDATELVLNLKDLAIKVRNDGKNKGPFTLHLSRSGSGEVTGADIETPPEVEIVNPEVHLATLDGDDASLEMEMTVELGRGFVLPESMEGYKHVIGVIPVGAAFTPVRKVNYVSEPTRRGSRIDLERLVLEIWTNGTITPREALGEAARILVDDYLRLFMEFSGAVAPEVIKISGEDDVRIEELGFSSKVENCLRKIGVLTLRDLLKKTEDDLLQIRNFGKKSLLEVRDRLASMGYELVPSKKIPQESSEEREEELAGEEETEDENGEV
jgi:DNA-directed RNA polymerase subunit alpha